MRKLKITLPFPKYLLCFIIIVAGITWYRLQYGRPKTYYHEQVTEITGIVYQIADDDDQMVLYVHGLERVRVTLYEKIEIKLGDCVTFTGKMKLPTGTPVFHLFQYDLYLRSKHIQWLFYADQGTIVSRNQNIFYEIKQGVIDHLKRYESEAYLKAFLLGDTSMFTDSDKQEFRALGISHLFAVSGMHVTLFTSLLMWLLRKWCSPPIMKTIVAVILGYYLFLTGFTPSVIRAVVMTIVLLWNQRISALSLLLFLGSVLLLYQPYYVYHPGFVFSFTVSFYLLLFRDWINASHCFFAQLI
ncbi:MAG: ComEC family competence protein [Bacilli bacterium]|nr:ComEC family competence protein [Bacilli bacterium]